MKPKFISLQEIRIGDTIVILSSHPKYRLTFLYVEDIEEGESNFKGYDINCEPVMHGEEYAVVVLIGTPMSYDGPRPDKMSIGRFNIRKETKDKFLLISRENND
jgi:hypothetical protein